MKNSKKWSGERLETSVYGKDAVDHLHRYAIAINYILNKIVLDIASGEGYGTNLLCNDATFVYGVDIDAESVAAASEKYKRKNLSFKQGSADAIPLPDNSIDVVVSFETIEHHDKHEEMMSEIKRVLKPGGIMIISTPDKLYYSDKRNFVNHFHVKELYRQEFTNLISQYFLKFQLLTQRYINGNSLIEDVDGQNIPIYSGNFSEIINGDADPTYLIAIATDDTFHKQTISIFDGKLITDTEVQNRLNKVYTSNTYSVGKILLAPLKLVKSIFK